MSFCYCIHTITPTIRTMIELNLDTDIYSDQFWSQLFYIINSCYHLAYVEYKGIKYINDEDADTDEYDEKMEVNGSKLTYKYIGEYKSDDESKLFRDGGVHDIVKKIAEMKCNPEEIVLISPENIIIRNLCGFNHDERGSDKMSIRLPFYTKVNLKKRFTLYDLLITNTKLKSHKFDNNYEMYCRARCQRCQTSNDSIEVDLVFDHGS